MAYISEAKHRELEIQLYQFFLENNNPGVRSADLDLLKKDCQLLQKMFHLYQDRLKELLKLIGEYQQIHRKARVSLRKQQLSRKQVLYMEKTSTRKS